MKNNGNDGGPINEIKPLKKKRKLSLADGTGSEVPPKKKKSLKKVIKDVPPSAITHNPLTIIPESRLTVNEKGNDCEKLGKSSSSPTQVSDPLNNIPPEDRTHLEEACRTNTLTAFHQVIDYFGQQKHLQSCLEAYRLLRQAGLPPTGHTFAMLINACVRCEDMAQATKIFDDMKDYPHVSADVVIFTTFLKGLCQDGDMTQAREIFLQKMVNHKPTIKPNVRTCNTVLRGCARNGDVDLAQDVWKTTEHLKISPDLTTCECLVQSLCQYLLTNEALTICNRSPHLLHQQSGGPSPAMLLSLATAYAIKGTAIEARKMIKQCRDLLGNAQDAGRMEKMGLDDGTRRSRALFHGHKNEQLEIECALVEQACNTILSPGPTNSRNGNVLSPPTTGGCVSCPRVLFLLKTWNVNRKPFQHSKPISFSRIFNNAHPIKVEICSGHGDWIVERAENDHIQPSNQQISAPKAGWVGGWAGNKPKSLSTGQGTTMCSSPVNWVAVEIRFDRIFSIWSRMRLKRLNNLFIVAGDARLAFQDWFGPQGITEVFMNFPDPAVFQKLGSNQEPLLDSRFIRDIHKTLRLGGCFTICTDNSICADVVMALLKTNELSALFCPADGSSYMTNDLPVGYGSSYFDRLWEHGNRNTRYFIRMKKR